MRFACFYQPSIFDWLDGDAHFVRGYASELRSRGHDVEIYEHHQSEHDLEVVLDGADVAIVHASSDPTLVARIGRHHALARRYALLFHDTHHRSPHEPRDHLSDYDGVLANSRVLRDRYLQHRWTARAWTWHAAADVKRFAPRETAGYEGDVVWLGHWGTDERTTELRTMLIEPVASLRLQARVYGLRFPRHARLALEAAGIEYADWDPGLELASVFSRFRTTIHLPHRDGARAGVPAVRLFEALACGIPMISGPWSDEECLLDAGRDYMVARDGDHVRQLLSIVIQDRSFAAALAANGRKTVLARHTCAHRVSELLAIVGGLG